MTFSDLYLDDLSGGRSLHQQGHLSGPAIDASAVLEEFARTGRATINPDHNHVADVELTITGEELIAALQETERRNGATLVERDGTPSVSHVVREHRYKTWYVES